MIDQTCREYSVDARNQLFQPRWYRLPASLANYPVQGSSVPRRVLHKYSILRTATSPYGVRCREPETQRLKLESRDLELHFARSKYEVPGVSRLWQSSRKSVDNETEEEQGWSFQFKCSGRD